MWDQREGRVRLPEGRWVHYADYGTPRGPVVVYCHGVPGSSHEIGWAAPVLRRSGVPIRLVALSRPGYGKSTWVDDAIPAGWAADATVALDRLGIEAGAVLGASGGAPFALAFAAVNSERVSRVGLVAAVGPPGVAGMDRSATWLTEPRSALRRRARYAALAAGHRVGAGRMLEERMLAALSPPDRAALATPEAREVVRHVVSDAFAQQGRAAAHEAGLLLRPWDLDLADVQAPVRVWHGARDTRVPVEVASGMANLLRAAPPTIWSQHGHFSWATSDAVVEVAEDLIQQRR